jgi:hypothetical protein
MTLGAIALIAILAVAALLVIGALFARSLDK